MSERVPDNERPAAEDAVVRQARPRLWSPDDAPLPPPPAPPVTLHVVTAPPTPSPEEKPRARRSPRKAVPPPEPQETARDDAAPSTPARPRYSPTIKDLPQNDRPRERLFALGAGALTTPELVAILIRVGTSQRSAVSLGEHLLAHFGSIGGLAGAAAEELAGVHGIGAAKAAQIKAAIEFGSRVSLFAGEARPAIGGPRDVANLLMPDLRYLKKEVLKSLLLDTKNKVLGIKTVSIGDLSSSIVHPREVFKDAVLASAASIIVAHNHPSGDPTPSAEDVAVTKRLMSAGEILGIDVLDHIVIGDGTFASLKERGLI